MPEIPAAQRLDRLSSLPPVHALLIVLFGTRTENPSLEEPEAGNREIIDSKVVEA